MSQIEAQGSSRFDLERILGPQFKEFASLLKDKKSLEPFLIKSFDKQYRPTNANENDIHPSFFQSLATITLAMREIENPKLTSFETVGKYAAGLEGVYDALVTGAAPAGPIAKTALNVDQFLFKNNNGIKHLVPGFNLLPFPSNAYALPGKVAPVPPPAPKGAVPKAAAVGPALAPAAAKVAAAAPYARPAVEPQTPFANLVQFLYHYIALLDLTNLTGRQVITFLNENDQLEFRRLAKEVAAGLRARAELPLEDPELALQGLRDGLGLLADQIIAQLKAIPATPIASEDIRGKITAADFKNVAVIKDIFKDIGITNYGDVHDRITTLIAKYAPAAGKQVNLDAVYNPVYLDQTKVLKEIPLGAPAPAGPPAPPGAPAAPAGLPALAPAAAVAAAAPAGGKVPSATFLYREEAGPPPKMVLVDIDDNVRAAMEQLGDHLSRNGDVNTNFARAAILGVVNYILTSPRLPDPADFAAGVGGNIRDHVNRFLAQYATVHGRIVHILQNPVAGKLAGFRDEFIRGFVLATGKPYAAQTGTIQLGPDAPKNNLSNPRYYKLYKNVILSDVAFYSDYFNLLKNEREEPNLKAAENVTGADLANYRLNVKKLKGMAYAAGGAMFGGAPLRWGDIMLNNLVPDYPSAGSKDLWIDSNRKVAEGVLAAVGAEALRDIIRRIYNSVDTTVDIYGIPVDIPAVAAFISSTGYSPRNWNAYLSALLARPFDAESLITPTWVEHESRLREHMLRKASEWVRDGDAFVRKDKTGKVLEEQAINNCAFITTSNDDCMAFLTQCALAEPSKEFPEMCKRMFDFKYDTNFKVNVAPTQIKDAVVNINPKVAFAILKKFHFGSYLTEDIDPFYGFRRFKVQSVSSWLQELLGASVIDRCKPQQPQPCPTLIDLLGKEVADRLIEMAKDEKYHPFFNYLSILVEWVNANPQVLNKEEIKPTFGPGRYPEISKKFNTYDYLNPYKPAELRLRMVSCGLERLKASIVNELAGAQGAAVISSVASIPLGIEAPFNRSAFLNPVPFTSGMMPMVGGQGGLYGLENELKNINYLYGYNLFSQIHSDLDEIMKGLVGKKMRLSSTTQQKIEQKLLEFKTLEEEIRKEILKLVERNQLYQASRGYVNSFDVPDQNWQAILAKHSNLLHLSHAYNKKATNIIDLFQTIAKAIIGKVEEGQAGFPGSIYERPMKMGYPTSIPPVIKKNPLI